MRMCSDIRFCRALAITMILWCAMSIARTPSSFAQEEVLVSSDISPKTLLVGDVITLSVFIRHEPGYSLYLPDLIDLAPFEIIDTKVKAIKKKGGRLSQATFKMSVYQSGIFTIPTMNLLLKKGDKRIEISTPQRKVEIKTILNKFNNALKEIYPPVDIRQSYLRFLVYVWIISLGLLITAIIYIRGKKRGAKQPRAKPAKREDPQKAARKMLDTIFSPKHLRASHDKEICEKLSFTIKLFLKEKFDIDSLEMTSY